MTPEQYARFAVELAKSLNERGWSWSAAFEAAGRITAEIASNKGIAPYRPR